uniref:Methyltransf_21 domain-containing protein n=1 Tax=Caenorhabditis japonica TaxID=281687 RepID=A0A8R1I1X5_CAEJA
MRTNEFTRLFNIRFFLIIIVVLFLLNFGIEKVKWPAVCTQNEATPVSVGTQVSTVPESSKVWDAIDGVGYQFKNSSTEVVLDKRFEELNNLPLCENLKMAKIEQEVKNKIDDLKKQFFECISPIVSRWKGNPTAMNIEWVSKARICDHLPIFKSIGVVPFANLHEIKWAILPKCKEENVMVTLGVGHDTYAEEKLNKTLPNTKFYGADPIVEPNRQMYSEFGKFFPFAIGREPGFTKFRVLPNQHQKTRAYRFEDVTTIPFVYFLSDILKLKKIDFAWFDIEGGEFQFLDQLHRDGPLDQKGVTICQMNLEVHSKFHPPGAQVFYDFIIRVLVEKRYVFLQSLPTDVGVHRMFFVNVENEECVAKFFQTF